MSDNLETTALGSETLSIAPLLASSEERFHVGGAEVYKSTTVSYLYDAYGNVM